MKRGNQKKKEVGVSARDQYFAGKISPEDYAKRILSIPVGDDVLKDSALKVKKITEDLERKRLIV